MIGHADSAPLEMKAYKAYEPRIRASNNQARDFWFTIGSFQLMVCRAPEVSPGGLVSHPVIWMEILWPARQEELTDLQALLECSEQR